MTTDDDETFTGEHASYRVKRFAGKYRCVWHDTWQPDGTPCDACMAEHAERIERLRARGWWARLCHWWKEGA